MGTYTALANYIDTILSGLNNKLYSLSISMVLSKTSDVLNHKVLTTKLEHYGFRSNFLDFLKNFVKKQKILC